MPISFHRPFFPLKKGNSEKLLSKQYHDHIFQVTLASINSVSSPMLVVNMAMDYGVEGKWRRDMQEWPKDRYDHRKAKLNGETGIKL